MTKTPTSFITVFCLFLLFKTQVSAQVIASATSGNWNATTTWVGGIIPSATDSVAIAGTHTVTVTANASCGALTIMGGATPTTLNINAATTLTVAKTVIVNRPNVDSSLNLLNVGAGTLTAAAVDLKGNNTNPSRPTRLSISTGTVNAVGNTTLAIDGSILSTGAASQVVFTGAGTINLTKNFMTGANPGTLTAGAGTIAVSGASTIIFGGYTYNNITVAGTSGMQFLGNTTIRGTFNNTANNLNVRVRGNLTSNGTFNAGTGIYYFESTTPTTNPATNLTLTATAITIDKINIDTNLTLTVPMGTTLTNTTSCVNYGTLTVNGTLTKTAGTYRGNGSFTGKTYTNAAIVSPGDSLGCLTFANGYDNGTGSLNLDFSGATNCTLHDRLVVTGTAKASGAVRVNFGAYIPTVGQAFTILSGATTYTGAFDSILITPRRINMTYANGTLTVSSITTSTHSVADAPIFKVKTSLVTESLTIVSADSEMTPLSISNLTGQVVMTTKVQGEQTISVGHLPKGLYFVYNQKGQVGRFVKQ